MRKENLIGKRFGRLTVIDDDKPYRSPSGKMKRKVICLCDCGKSVSVRTEHIKSGATMSCGCLQKDIAKECNSTHNMSNTRLYGVWRNIIDRCSNVNNIGYKNYGGRGIKLCDEWKDFKIFAKWSIDNGYDELAKFGYCTIDRVDVNGNYEPNNCRWTTLKNQENNRTNNRNITYKGTTRTLTEWAEYTGISQSTLWFRLKSGWSIEKSIETPCTRSKRKV